VSLRVGDSQELTVQIAVISDTHLPRGTRRLPDACVERLRRADLIVHAGDLMTIAALRELEAYGEVVAVHGNVDDAEVRAALPSLASAVSLSNVALVSNASESTLALDVNGASTSPGAPVIQWFGNGGSNRAGTGT